MVRGYPKKDHAVVNLGLVVLKIGAEQNFEKRGIFTIITKQICYTVTIKSERLIKAL